MEAGRSKWLVDGRARARRHRFDDSGAAMVEFALILPVLVLLLFGIFEFGFLFGQYLDVRHGARETARLVSVNYNPNDTANPTTQAADIVTDACGRMELSDDVDVTLSLPGDPDAGDFAVVRVQSKPTQITGLFSPIISNIDLVSEVDIRLEQEATWTSPYTGSC